MSTRNPTLPRLRVLAAALMVAGLGPTAAQMETTTSTNALFRFSYPPTWVIEEHADGAGVLIATSTSALRRFTAGEATAPGDLILNLTFNPLDVFGFLFLEPESGATPAALADAIMPALGAAEGTEAGETEIVALESGREIAMTPVANRHAEGAVVLYEAAEGVIALVTVVGCPGEFESIRDAALEVAATIGFDGTAEQLLDVIEPPDPLPFTPV